MAAATVNKRFITVLGPVKMEFINVTASDTNTVTSNLQNPDYAIAVNNQDGANATAQLNATISGRTITLNSDDLGSDEVNILVFGF